MSQMKRLQILIEEDLDEALALEARRAKTSKAELIRRYVRQHLGSPVIFVDTSFWVHGGVDLRRGLRRRRLR